MKRFLKPPLTLGLLQFMLILVCEAAAGPAQPEAKKILAAAGFQGGIIVHLGCGDGQLTAALGSGENCLVQGLTTDPAQVAGARAAVRAAGPYGDVSIDCWDGRRLPYIDNLINLIVAADPAQATPEELLRAVAPGGVVLTQENGAWKKLVKPRPPEIDEWTHYMHDPGNNAVAHDTVVGPPRRVQWIAGPRYSRHHDRMSSFQASVTAGNRLFTILDEGSRFSILTPPSWQLIARDAFNGVVLWKRAIEKWHTTLWPLKSGPAPMPRRLVAVGERVYATLSIDAPVTALDAATGKTVRTYEQTRGAEEILLEGGVLFVLVNTEPAKLAATSLNSVGAVGFGSKFYDEAPRRLMAIRADSGQTLWSIENRILPLTLAADARAVYFHDGQSVVCLDRAAGKPLWRSEPVDRPEQILAFFAPTLVVAGDVVLFSGGKGTGMQSQAAVSGDRDTMTAFAAATGKTLWTAPHPPSGYRSPEDLFVARGLVWTEDTINGGRSGIVTGRDLHTGEVKVEFPPDVETYWFHHRCYRGKATDNFLLTSRTGVEFIDIQKKSWDINHFVRGACLYGVMPANGLLYAPQHPCACYLETKLFGLNALAPAAAGPRVPAELAKAERLEKGPAYAEIRNPQSAIDNSADWPTFRHDAGRSGRTASAVPAAVAEAWQAKIGGRLTALVIAEGKAFVASIDSHTVHALDAASGKPAWTFTAGGRVDSPPTIQQGRAIFGATDGYVYCLRAADGALAWRFRAAPMDQKLMYFEQLESVWPVSGSVLIQDGAVCCVAGRSVFLDGGLRLLRLDPATGRLLSETLMDERGDGAGKEHQSFTSWLNMPAGLPDVLSSDGKRIFMRSQAFAADGTRLPLEAQPKGGGNPALKGAPPAIQHLEFAHLFSPTGFLDDTFWHRTYWIYGSTFVSGWSGYYLSGQTVPSGRILVYDDKNVYGYGRKPEYYRWTTPIEQELFMAAKPESASVEPDATSAQRAGLRAEAGASIKFDRTASPDPTGKALTVEAWVKAEKPDGVVLSHGGNMRGYSLYLQGGKPRFAVRAAQALGEARAAAPAAAGWVHLAGVLTADKQILLYIDGKQAAAAKAPGLIDSPPAQGLEIGSDEGPVADYPSPSAFTGLIDELRIWTRALDAAEIAAHAAGARLDPAGREGLAFSSSFEGKISDTAGKSGGKKKKARAAGDGAAYAEGKVGQALRLTGRAGKAAPRAAATASKFAVKQQWAKDLPIFARAMVLAGDVIFVAGPPDLVDEEAAFKALEDPAVKQALAGQQDSLNGGRGAQLMAIARASGEKLGELKLDTLPVFDGLAAAGGRLYLSTTDGRVICLGGKP